MNQSLTQSNLMNKTISCDTIMSSINLKCVKDNNLYSNIHQMSVNKSKNNLKLKLLKDNNQDININQMQNNNSVVKLIKKKDITNTISKMDIEYLPQREVDSDYDFDSGSDSDSDSESECFQFEDTTLRLENPFDQLAKLTPEESIFDGRILVEKVDKEKLEWVRLNLNKIFTDKSQEDREVLDCFLKKYSDNIVKGEARVTYFKKLTKIAPFR